MRALLSLIPSLFLTNSFSIFAVYLILRDPLYIIHLFMSGFFCFMFLCSEKYYKVKQKQNKN